jgi:type IV secretory pathway TraG/TraD family ATPase VirD4
VSWTHGAASAWLALALTAAGLLVGTILGRASLKQTLASLVLAIPLTIVTALVWNAILWLAPVHLGENVNALLGIPFFLLVAAVAGKLLAGRRLPGPEHKRGTLLGSKPEPSQTHGRDGLTLAGQRVDPVDETKHFKLIGTTGTGKSTAIRELLEGALERGDRAVIADPDFSYVNRFYDPSRGDVILNPFDERAARWDLFAEMTTLYDADQLARSLIVDTEGTEKPWRNYARVFLTSLLRQLHRVRHDDVGELYRLLSVTPVEDLRDLLNDTPAGPYLVQDNGKFFGAVRAVANTHLGALEPIALQRTSRSLSVRNWIQRAGSTASGVLFLPYRANEIATLRSLISTWMRLAIFEAMSQNEGDRRLWFVIDELDALGQIDGLKDALARLRKFGGRCVLGFQSIAQVSGTYGHAEAQTIVENCGNTLILRCSASEGGGTARFASKLIGEREILREQVTRNAKPGLIISEPQSISKSIHHVIETAVMPSEIEQLPDLQGFLKLASQPEWRRVQLRPN